MRWSLYIISFLFLLTFGVELCSLSSGTAEVKGASHLVCLLDDDDVELKLGGLRDHLFTDCDLLSLPGQHVMTRWVKQELISSLEGAEVSRMHPGVRRHRWLCKECC
jgi:hypothetical protein